MAPIFAILLLCLPQLFASAQETDPYTAYSQLNLPDGASGPAAIARDPSGQGPYVAISDGRILKYNDIVAQFVDFANISPDRPLGFSFDQLNGDLYVVGAYGGFFKVGLQGQVTPITSVNGTVSFNFLSGVSVDWVRRVVYLIDASSVYKYTGAQAAPSIPDDLTGRLIQYNIITGEFKVLLNQLPFPSGPVVSVDGMSVLYSSVTHQQIFKYDLIGGTTSVVLDQLPGYSLKLTRAVDYGFFWAPVNVVVQQQPRVVQSYGYKFNSNGYIVLKKNFTNEHSEADDVQEYVDYNILGILVRRTLYVGSRIVPFVGVYNTWALI